MQNNEKAIHQPGSITSNAQSKVLSRNVLYGCFAARINWISIPNFPSKVPMIQVNDSTFNPELYIAYLLVQDGVFILALCPGPSGDYTEVANGLGPG